MSIDTQFVIDGEVMVSYPPPDWPTDKFSWKDPVRILVKEHYFVFGVLASLALIALCQRFYTKIYLSNGLGIDDCTRQILTSLVITGAYRY
jgi:hypothetical protein